MINLRAMARGKIEWTEEMLSYLRDNYKTMCYEDMGYHLGISHSTVRLKCVELGYFRKHGGVRKVFWSESDIAYLREHFSDMPACDIAIHLRKQACMVTAKAKELGLRKREGWKTSDYCGRYVKNYRNYEGREGLR